MPKKTTHYDYNIGIVNGDTPSIIINDNSFPKKIRDLADTTMRYGSENILLEYLFTIGLITQYDCNTVSEGISKLVILKSYGKKYEILPIPYADDKVFFEQVDSMTKTKLEDLIKNNVVFSNLFISSFEGNSILRDYSSVANILEEPANSIGELNNISKKLLEKLKETPLYRFKLAMIFRQLDKQREIKNIKSWQNEDFNPVLVELDEKTKEQLEDEMSFLYDRIINEFGITGDESCPIEYGETIPPYLGNWRAQRCDIDTMDSETLAIIRTINRYNEIVSLLNNQRGR